MSGSQSSDIPLEGPDGELLNSELLNGELLNSELLNGELPNSGPSPPPNYSPGSSRNAECSNCKHLRGKINVLKATMDMHMHPVQHIVNSAALLHEVINEMEKLDLE
ncbi:hypothetical protein Tco_0295112 [Tanacetum coccineum]